MGSPTLISGPLIFVVLLGLFSALIRSSPNRGMSSIMGVHYNIKGSVRMVSTWRKSSDEVSKCSKWAQTIYLVEINRFSQIYSPDAISGALPCFLLEIRLGTLFGHFSCIILQMGHP